MESKVNQTAFCVAYFPEQINPQVFEGCKVALGKGLSRYFQTTHTLVLGTSQPASYQYGITYVGSKKIAENDVSHSSVHYHAAFRNRISHWFFEIFLKVLTVMKIVLSVYIRPHSIDRLCWEKFLPTATLALSFCTRLRKRGRLKSILR